jgi:ubiquinone/menaquinone biosynthesis C-methylase UbiE
MIARDPTQRFSDRVENYIRARPGYPHELLATFKTECGLTPESPIADVASGTGIFTRMLLENGNPVFAVEPNSEMRLAAERLLAGYPKLTSVEGSAEDTTLPDHSVAFVTAAQAAHWFDLDRAHREFARILQPRGWVSLIWNERLTAGNAFLHGYEQLLLTYATDYKEVRHEQTTAVIGSFFSPIPYRERTFANAQQLDYTMLEQRLLSSSYVPLQGHPKHAAMILELRRLFDASQTDGRVRLDYQTRVFYGQFS